MQTHPPSEAIALPQEDPPQTPDKRSVVHPIPNAPPPYVPESNPSAPALPTPSVLPPDPAPQPPPFPTRPKGKHGGLNVPHPVETKEIVKALYIQGLTPLAIQQRTGICAETVRKWGRVKGWQAVREAMLLNHQRAATIVVQDSLTSVSKRLRSKLADELADQVDVLRAKRPTKPGELADNKQRQGRAKVAKTIVESASMVFGWEQEVKVGLIVPMCGLEQPAACGSETPTGSVREIEAEVQTPQLAEVAELEDEAPAG